MKPGRVLQNGNRLFRDRHKPVNPVSQECGRIGVSQRNIRVLSFSSQTLRRLHSRFLSRPVSKAQPPYDGIWSLNLRKLIENDEDLAGCERANVVVTGADP